MKNGYCFIEFEDGKEAEEAVKQADGTGLKKKILKHFKKEINGSRLKVEFSKTSKRERSPRRSQNRVIVENLDPRVSWQDLKDLMRREGDVLFTDVVNDRHETYG
jgi:RNA recognition motif-containing protein